MTTSDYLPVPRRLDFDALVPGFSRAVTALDEAATAELDGPDELAYLSTWGFKSGRDHGSGARSPRCSGSVFVPPPGPAASRICGPIDVFCCDDPGRAPSMGKELSVKERKRLSDKSFALPGKRKYPIPDKAHARNALARVAQHGTPAEQKKVEAAVRKRFPSIGKSSVGKKGKRKGKREKS